MTEQISSYIVGAALVTLAGCFAAPFIKVALGRMRRQGIAFALIGAGFLVSMATKPSGSGTTVIQAEPVTGASSVSVKTNGQDVVAVVSADKHYYTVETGALVTVTWKPDDGYQFPGLEKGDSFPTNVTASLTADVTNEVALAASDLPAKYLTDVTIDQGSAITLTVGATTNLTITINPTDAATNDVYWTSTYGTYASVDNNGKVTAVAVGSEWISVGVADKFGHNEGDDITVTVVPAPVQLVEVKADAVTGASVQGAYTNEVKVAGDSPWTVVSGATVAVVYTAGSGYVFADGNTVFTNTVKATEAETSATLTDEQKPIAVVNVQIPQPVVVKGLVYNGTEQIGITNIDARLTVGPGVTNGTDVCSTNCAFTLPDNNAFTNYQFVGLSKRRTALSMRIRARPITLKSASATKVWDGTELTTDKVEVVSGSYAPNEEFVYDVTGTQTAVGWSTNFYTVADNGATSPKTKLSNYSITQEYGILTVTDKPTTMVSVDLPEGAEGALCFTNTISATTQIEVPCNVYQGDKVFAVFKVKDGYLFPSGLKTCTNETVAAGASMTISLSDEQKPKEAEAKVSGKYYLTLAAALASSEWAEAELCKDVTLTNNLTIANGQAVSTVGHVLTINVGVTNTVQGGFVCKAAVKDEVVNQGAFVIDGGVVATNGSDIVIHKSAGTFIKNADDSVLTFAGGNCTVTGAIEAFGVGEHGHKFILGDADAGTKIMADPDKVPAASIDLAENLKQDYVVVYEQGCYVAKKTMPAISYQSPVYKTPGDPTSGVASWVTLTTNLYTVVTSETAAVTWNAGWYVVTNEVNLSKGAQCNGAVHLILADGAKLTAKGGDWKAGITVDAANVSLTIYGQSAGTGELIATGGTAGAGIGGDNNKDGMNITVNGGKVTATGGEVAAGIGGGTEGGSSNIRINGGKVKATAGELCGNAIGDGGKES